MRAICCILSDKPPAIYSVTKFQIVSDLGVIVLLRMAWQQLLLGTFLIADGDLMEWMDPQIDAVVQRPTKVKSPVITAEYVSAFFLFFLFCFHSLYTEVEAPPLTRTQA